MMAIILIVALAAAMIMSMVGRAGFERKKEDIKRRVATAKGKISASGRELGGRDRIPMDDCDYREGDVTAVDTLTSIPDRAGSSEGGFSVGGDGRKYLTSLTISAAAILTKGTGVLTGAIWIELSGTGLAKGGNYKFLGPTMTVQVDTSENAACIHVPSVTYPTAIECKKGDIDVKAGMTGDDLGTVNVVVTASFANMPTPGGLIDMDIREGAATAVNTEAGMTVLGGDTLGDFDVPAEAVNIDTVAVLAVPDPPTTIAEVHFSAVIHLTGTGFKEGGDRYFGCDGVCFGGDTAGSCHTAHGPKIYGVDIPVKDGKIHATGTMLGTDPGGQTYLVALGYV